MELYPYNALNLKKRADHLWHHGSFVAVCRAREPFVLYYMINDFFVELEYDPAQVSILGLTAFSKGERYERMVGAIRLDLLMDAS
jgi:hypothetical protein